MSKYPGLPFLLAICMNESVFTSTYFCPSVVTNWGTYVTSLSRSYYTQLKTVWQLWRYILMQRMIRNLFEREMLLRKLQTTLLQIFCKNIFESQVITKSIIDPDDTYVILQSRSYYTQLKTVWRLWRYLLMQRMLRKIFEGEMLLRKLQTTLLHLFYKTIFES